MNSGNILALDVGNRRIGVAIASSAARLPMPLLTIDRNEHDDVFGFIKQLVNDNDVKILVIGLPRGMQGQETGQTVETRKFAGELKKELDMQIELQEEAGTSLQAEEELKVLKRPYDKGDIDKTAAAIILHDWLAGATVEQV